MTGWEEKPSRWFSKRIKKRRTDGRERCSHACCSITSLSYPNSNTRENGRLAVGVYFYLFIYFPFRVGCWLYKLTTTELWASRRKWSRQFHALSSFFFFSSTTTTAVLCCCYYYTTRVCVYCQAKKWRLGVISGYHVFFVFFLSPPNSLGFLSAVSLTTILWFYLFSPPPSLLCYTTSKWVVHVWNIEVGVVVEEIESGEKGEEFQ